MKLLQVANVAQKVGGTGACAYTIARALPDWRHAYQFVNSGIGPAADSLRADFGCDDILREPRLTPEIVERFRPDVILFHNTAPDRIPRNLPAGIATFYYQHSHHRSARAARDLCDAHWAVSTWLAREAGIEPEFVLHQPVPRPPKPDGAARGEFTIGRIATPCVEKWNMVDVPAFYRQLAERHPDVLWEFVGCPDYTIGPLDTACFGRASFFKPSWELRSRVWNWHGYLYHGGVESYGRCCCEAQRSGCVPIVDRQGGFLDQIRDGETGFLCGNADEFANAIGAVRERFAELSAAAEASGNERGSLQRWRVEFLRWVEAALR